MDFDKIFRLPPTRRIYNAFPYRQKDEAQVLYVEGCKAVFDRTIFYAESGGQTFDTGTIEGCKVNNVQKILGEYKVVKNPRCANVPSVKVNTRIVHEFDHEPAFTPGQTVVMKIDWERRYKIMKNHTLCHFLYYGITEAFAHHNEDLFLKGCAIDEVKGGFSLNNGIDNDLFEEIKGRVCSSYLTPSEITMTPEPSNDEVFYWECNGIVIPCGGTHIENTSELAEFQISKKSGGKGKTKIYIAEKSQDR